MNFSHKKSPLKSKLSQNDLTIGTWLTIPHPSVVEILSTAGFEWITIDMEHAAIDVQTMQNLIAHIQGNGMEALVRVSKNEEVIIKKAMDAGANGVIVPMIKNKEDAQKAVSLVKYPSEGIRGVGLSRAQHYGIGFESYQEWLKNESVVILQIEHIGAVDQLEEILDVEGVDGLIVGPYDLSASMGKPGKFNEADVIEAIDKVKRIAVKKNVPFGFHVISSNHEELIEKVKQQCTLLAFSLDFFFLGDKARSEMEALKLKL